MPSFPRLQSIISDALQGDVGAVLKALASRQDYQDNRKHKAAVEAVAWLGDNPKRSVTEAELVGHTKAGEIPYTSDILAQAIIRLAEKKCQE